MAKLLHVNSSPRGESSKSLAIAHTFLDTYQMRHPELKVDTWDLFQEPLPNYATDAAAAKMAAFARQKLSPEQEMEWARCKIVYDRFVEADEYLFNVPMWNHGVPYPLKQWIDIITQPGWVFDFHPEHGYQGLVKRKRAFVIYTSGVYQTGGRPGFGADFHAKFFNDWLRFIGITEVTDLYYSGYDLLSPEQAAVAYKATQTRAQELASVW
ncbi:FMN-dependent NADH-azoreductase [Actinomadura coerulea]|uniref:FMN-dependent NADH-azoreductase n=1 Tax=Actinomadura coerulea TaxID=46159 RepID=UPI003422F8A9